MKLFFRTYGNGPPLIILHGLYGSSDNWVTIARSVAGSFTVFLPDQRNHGQSPHSTIHDYVSMRDDLFELAEELKLKKFFLAGHSMGGKTAMHFALKWPERLNGLLVADISPFASKSVDRPFYRQHLEILNTILSIDVARYASRNEIEKEVTKKIPSDRIRGFVLKNLQRGSDNSFFWKLNAASLHENIENIMDGVERPDDKTLYVSGFPVIFLRSEGSEYLPAGDFRDIRRLFPAAEFINVENSGHWIHADRPDAFEANLLRLMNG